MRKHLPIFLWSVAALAAIPTVSRAQTINPIIEVERRYDARLMEVSKPKLDTRVPDSLLTFPTLMEYTIYEKPLQGLYEFQPLPQAVMHSNTQVRHHTGFLRAGAAYPVSAQGDLLWQSVLTPHTFLDLQATNRTLYGKNPAHKRLRNRGDLKLTHRGVKNTFYLELDGQHVRYSGLRAFDVGGKIGLYASAGIPGPWQYYFELGYAHAKKTLLGNEASHFARENYYYIDGGLHYQLLPTLQLGLDAAGHFVSNQWANSPNSSPRGIGHLLPHVSWGNERFLLEGGAWMGIEALPEKNSVHIYPWGRAHATLIDRSLRVFAQLNGRCELNTFRDRINENPLLSCVPSMREREIPWDVTAGIEGSLGNRLGYRLYGQYRYTKGQYYYVDDWALYATSGPLKGNSHTLFSHLLSYANETRYSLGGALSYTAKSVEAQLQGAWHHYQLCTNTPPWHTPSYEVNASVRYNWHERVVARAECYLRSKCYAQGVVKDQPLEIPAFANLQLSVEYLLTKSFGVYVYGENLLNQDIAYFYAFSDPGLTVGAGLSLRF